MARVSQDQSATIRCPEHGRRACGLFVRPDADEGFPAFYACPHCAEKIIGTAQRISREQALSLRRLK